MSAQRDRPRVLTFKPENIPLGLRRAGGQFVTWRLIFIKPKDATKPGKWTKVPTQPHGAYASSTNAATWWNFENCVEAYKAGRADGVGFVTASDPYVLIDLDKCFDPTTGVIDSWAVPILDAARRENAYIELSPSGTGYHIIGKGPQSFKGMKNNGAELYCTGRFFTLTGWLPFGVSKPTLGKLNKTIELVSKRIGATVVTTTTKAKKSATSTRVATATVAGKRPYVASMSDADILKMAFRKKNGPKLKRLLDGDISEYGDDESRADLAAASLLSFWFWLDPVVIERVMRASKLRRTKWDSKRGGISYLRYTIERALEGKVDYFGKPRPVAFTTYGYRTTAGDVGVQI